MAEFDVELPLSTPVIDFRFKLRRGTAAEWAAKNPILLAGEPGFEIDTQQYKIGDGAHTYSDLPYFLSTDGIRPYVDQAIIDALEDLEAEGIAGDSAYQVAVKNGFVGTELEWLASLHGDDGAPGGAGTPGGPGADGDSAYQIALDNGFVGTQTAWLASLKGDKGDKGEKGDTGNTGGTGGDGKSAYQLAVINGFVGNEAAWLLSLKGSKGDKGDTGNAGGAGANGSDGKSAYQVAVANGFVGTEAAWLLSLKGASAPSLLPSYGAGDKLFDSALSAYNVTPSNTRRAAMARDTSNWRNYSDVVQVNHELWIGDSMLGGCTGLTAGPGGTIRFSRLESIAHHAAAANSSAAGGQVPGTGLVRWKDNTRLDDRITYSFTPGAVSALPLTTGQYADFATNLPGNKVHVTWYDNFTGNGFDVIVGGVTTNVVGTNTSKWRHTAIDVVVGVGDKIRVIGKAGTTQHGFVSVTDTRVGGTIPHNVATSGSKVVGDWDQLTSGFSKVRMMMDSGALWFVPSTVHLVFPYFDVPDNPGNATPFKNSMQTLINQFVTTSDVILHAPPLPGRYRGAGGDPTASFMPYLTALYELASTNYLPLLDMHHMTGGYHALQPMGLAGDDTTHWMPPVYRRWGRAASAMIPTTALGTQTKSNGIYVTTYSDPTDDPNYALLPSGTVIVTQGA